MNEDNDKLENGSIEPEKEQGKKKLYSYSADEDRFLNMPTMQDNSNIYRNKYKYEYTNEMRNHDVDDVNSKSDITFILCIIAGCLNFVFGFLFLALNFKYTVGGISALGSNILISDNTVDILLVFLILFVLFIASFAFLFIYKASKTIGIFGIITCCLVCLLCLFVESFTVVVQLILYIVAIIIFFNKYMENRRLSY